LEEETRKKEEALREKYNLANKRRQELIQEKQEKAIRASKPKQLIRDNRAEQDPYT
jgi:hypothetical protein